MAIVGTTTFSLPQWIDGRARGHALESQSEAKLIAKAGEGGDHLAFQELVRRHEVKVRSLLIRLSGGNSALADDLAQEVFLRAFRGMSAFEGRSKFSTWLYRISYNVYLNHRSRAKELSPLPKNFEPLQNSRIECGNPGAADLRRDLENAISNLPPRYRSVLVLFYLEEISYPEIAEVLDLPLGTVKTHLHRAKKMLKSQLSSWK